jgi:hypothetical protein
VWKLAFKAAEDEKCNLQKHMLKLEKNIGSLRVGHLISINVRPK